MTDDLDPATLVSVVVIWLLVLSGAAVVLTASGLLTLPLDATVLLLVLGGVLLLAVVWFVRYYGGADRVL